MTFPLTLILLALAVSASLFCAWRGSRPRPVRIGARRIPWQSFMLAFFATALALAAHLAALGLDHEPPSTVIAATALSPDGKYKGLFDAPGGEPRRLHDVVPEPVSTLPVLAVAGIAPSGRSSQ